jgi:hypothetical protein
LDRALAGSGRAVVAPVDVVWSGQLAESVGG